MTINSLAPESLRRLCDANRFKFQTTAELDEGRDIIGQPRGTRSLTFGLDMRSQGYNIFVVGDSGTGRMTAIQQSLEARAATEETPPDWVYVHNFSRPHSPRALALPPGRGASLRDDVAAFIDLLRRELQRAFTTDGYYQTVDSIEGALSAQQEELLDSFEEEAAARQFTLLHTSSGPLLAPVRDGKVLNREAFAALPLAQRRSLERVQSSLNEQLEDVMLQVHRLDQELQQELATLDEGIGASTLEQHFPQLEEKYAGLPQVADYLRAMKQDLLRHMQGFLSERQAQLMRRYEVNLFVDNGGLQGAPVVLEPHPNYANLLGRVEYEMVQGLMRPHFTTLRAGSLHRANGGYLILYARDIAQYADAWEALKRALKAEKLWLQPPEALHGAPVLAQSLDPEPIPLSVKTILAGDDDLYYRYFDHDEEFSELFKVKAEFEASMVRDEAHELQYAQFIAEHCRREKLCHFERDAVAKVVEYGSRLCEDQNRLSTRFGDIADFIREVAFWAVAAERDVVTVDDVQRALTERIYRANRYEERIREQIMEGDLLIATDDAVVGQVNGLSVLDLGDYMFGTPGRITARTYMGEDGVVNIEREVDMAGPIHNKGLLTLIGYLGGTYAQDQPLSLSASLTFEQNYMEVEGDSASAAELIALLSSLSGLPVRQAVAVTGSINQHGQMQAVGGVTEKIEGFFYICKQRGLTGEQGVVIPRANVNNLMLHEEVIEAVREERFHVWAADSVDEGMELLLGVPAGARDESGHYPPGTVHHMVQRALQRLALDLKSFGDRAEYEDGEE
ncbi:MAG: Lon protease family protein [Chloroflexota bacterium]